MKALIALLSVLLCACGQPDTPESRGPNPDSAQYEIINEPSFAGGVLGDTLVFDPIEEHSRIPDVTFSAPLTITAPIDTSKSTCKHPVLVACAVYHATQDGELASCPNGYTCMDCGTRVGSSIEFMP